MTALEIHQLCYTFTLTDGRVLTLRDAYNLWTGQLHHLEDGLPDQWGLRPLITMRDSDNFDVTVATRHVVSVVSAPQFSQPRS